MFPIFFIKHLLVGFIKTVLTDSPSVPNESSTGTPIWLIAIMVFLAICVLLLLIYLIRKYYQRKSKEVKESVKKAEEKKAENAEQAEVAPSEITRALSGIDLHSCSDAETLSISERRIIQNDQNSLLDEDEKSASVILNGEYHSSTKVGEDMSEKGTLSDDENDLEFEKDDDTVLIDGPNDEKAEEVEDQIADDSDHSKFQEEVVPEANKGPEDQEQNLEKMDISENLKGEELAEEEDSEEFSVLTDKEEDESVPDSPKLEQRELLVKKEVASIKEIRSGNTTAVETSSDEHNEDSLTYKENMKSPEYLASLKAGKSPWSRKFSKISSSVLRNARNHVDTSSSENEF